MRPHDTLKIDGIDSLSPVAMTTASLHLAAIQQHLAAIDRLRSLIDQLIADDEKWRSRTPRDRLAAMVRRHRIAGHSWPAAARIVARETGWPASIVSHAAQTRDQELRRRIAERKRADIERLYRQGKPYREIEKRVGVSGGYIATVIKQRIGPKPRRQNRTPYSEN